MGAMIIHAMQGLGDNVYSRGFVRHFPGAYVITPWPELYADLKVKCTRPLTKLRTQAKNLAATAYAWHQLPQRAERQIRLFYTARDLAVRSIPETLARLFGVSPVFDLPPLPASPFAELAAKHRIAIVRPVTTRREWINTARNPDPAYVARASAILRRRGYFVISIADLAIGQEWAEPPLPDADLYVHDGRLSVLELLAAIAAADVVVGGVGWIVPACIAAGTPLYCVLGGNGGNNRPEALTDASSMRLDRIGWAKPDEFCECVSNKHNCKKVIHGFDERFKTWLRQSEL